MPDSIPKVRELAELRAWTQSEFIISIDGGIGDKNIVDVSLAGADLFVAGSSVLGKPDIATAFKTLDTLANG